MNRWTIGECRSGLPNLLLNGHAVHSRYDPVREARRAAEAVPPEASVVILGGFGLGYVAQALLEAAPERRLIIAEADEFAAVLASQTRDLDAVLNHPKVSLIAGGRPQLVSTLMKGSGQSHLIVWEPCRASHPRWYGQLEEEVRRTARRMAINERTLERFGRLWVRNLTANSSVLQKALPLRPWSNHFKGIPALILAGGPGLELVLPYLAQLAERCLLIAVDTALPALRRCGVSPDIVAAVDPQYWNARHLDRCAETAADALVIAELGTHPAVFRTLGGRPWLIRSKFPLGTVLEDAAGISGSLKAGGSVSTAAWDLGCFLGCQSLTAAGLDLGFPNRQTHYSGSQARERPHTLSKRISPAQTFFYRILHDAGPRYTESADGHTVLSDQRMDVYAAWFAEHVPDSPCPAVIGGQGRKIPGMGRRSADEMLRLPEIRPRITRLLNEVRQTPADPQTARRVEECLNSIGSALEELRVRAVKGARLSRMTARALRSGTDPGPWLKKLEQNDQELLTRDGRDVVSFLIQPLIRKLEQSSDNPLEASFRLYLEISDSAQYHLDCLRRADRPG